VSLAGVSGDLSLFCIVEVFGPSGVIEVAYARPDANTTLQTATLSLSPVDNIGSIGWTCRSTLANRYLPSACRTS